MVGNGANWSFIMSQFIKVKTKDKGEVLDMAIQQYEVGLYVCIYQNGRMVDQFGSQLSQTAFVEKLKQDDNLEIISLN